MKLTNLTAEERMQMISMGLNPLKSEHIEAFKSGAKINRSEIMRENINRLAFGDKNALRRKNLGSGKERDISEAEILSGKVTADNFDSYVNTKERSYNPREEIRMQMENYSSFSNEPQQSPIDVSNTRLGPMTVQFLQLFLDSVRTEMFETALASFSAYRSVLNTLNELKKNNPSEFEREFQAYKETIRDFYQQIKK